MKRNILLFLVLLGAVSQVEAARITGTGGSGTGVVAQTCTNQFARSVDSVGAWTCEDVVAADVGASGTPSATTFFRGDNVWATPSGGGNVTTGTLTANIISKSSGATAIANSLLTDNATTLSYTGTGGISAASFTSTGSSPGILDLLEGAAPSLAASGHGRIYADSTSHTFKCSNNGGAYADCGGSGGSAGNLTGDITSVGLATTMANIPTAVPMAGSLLATTIAAPSTPAAGKSSVYVDSTSKNISVIDDAGVVKHGVQTKAAVSNSFVTAISDAGVVTVAQPTGSDLSLSDVTTNDVTTGRHGFAPKLPNDSSKYLDGTGAYSVPAGGGGGSSGNNNALFTSTADGANNALASDTTIIGTGVGSKTTAANYFVAGTSLMMVLRGTISTAATPATLAIKIKAGSVVVCQTTAQTLTALLSSSVWEINLLVTNRTAGASGTFKCNGIFASTGTALAPLEAPIADTGNAVDTTGTIGWDVTAVWGSTTAGDTITGTNFVMFTPGTGLADPGGNGILVRTALNTTSAGNLSGDVTSSNLVTTLANIPTGTPAVGSILRTNIAAPSSPAAGKVSTYTDSTDLRFHDKNASGVIGTTVVADTGTSNNFLTAISAAGAISKAQPAFTNILGTCLVAQGCTGQTTLTNHGVLVGAATTAITQLAAAAAGTALMGQGTSSDPAFSATPTLGVAGTTKGTLAFAGNTSGTVTVQPAAAAGTWSLTLPTSAGSSGQVLQTDGAGVTTWAAAGTSLDTAIALTSDATANATTTGVKITGLDLTTGTGTFIFRYYIRNQTSVVTTGVKFGINHTGTATVFMAQMRFQSLTGAPTQSTQASPSGTPVAIAGAAARAFSTTAPNMGPITQVDTANADMLVVIDGLIIVTGTGNLELWHASETAASTTVMTGSSLVLTKTN